MSFDRTRFAIGGVVCGVGLAIGGYKLLWGALMVFWLCAALWDDSHD